ncbi:MAG: TIGR00730 family Rossman fold protein [Clostridia bacterium]|nr:TIGR00730 family Rossman fold protein [Clostridia bacterium]
MKIAIYGASSSRIDEKYIKVVEDFGELCAKRNHSLVFGGGSSGIMGAAARGFKKANGYVHGFVPTFFFDCGYKAIFYDADEITKPETMAERKTLMENECDAFVIAPGGIGTFEEFFETLTLKQLGRHNKPIVMLNAYGFYDELEAFMQTVLKKDFVTDATLKLYKSFDNAEDVLNYIENYNEPPMTWDDLKIGTQK